MSVLDKILDLGDTETERLNQIIRDQEKELVEIRGRAATIESTFASLQEVNTKLEWQRDKAARSCGIDIAELDNMWEER